MAVFKDTITIEDRPWDRAVEVTVIYPDGVNVLNLQELAAIGVPGFDSGRGLQAFPL
jgi:hypothetical protein